MTSLIAWLDHDERDRRRMREVIDLFREQDTLDELGIGVVRDTLANLLFPGTTTVQTRARYLLFLPWIYEEIERLRLSGNCCGDRSEEARDPTHLCPRARRAPRWPGGHRMGGKGGSPEIPLSDLLVGSGAVRDPSICRVTGGVLPIARWLPNTPGSPQGRRRG